MRAPRRLLLGLLVLAFLVVSDRAFARGSEWFQLSLDGAPTWLARAPELDIGTDSGTTFNALRGAALPAAGPAWFGGAGFDTRAGAKRENWFVPLVGVRFGLADFHASLANGDGVTTTLDTLIYTELLLPGFGVRLGDHFSLAARLAYVRLDTSGSATDGHITMAVDAGADGFGVLGDAQACLGPRSSVCLFAEPAATWIGGPDFAVTFGVRLVLVP